MKSAFLVYAQRLCTGPLVALMAIVLLTGCDQGNSTKSATATPRPPTASATTAVIRLGPQPCPAAVQAPAYWNPIVHASAPNVIEGVICGYLMGIPSLQAVVRIRSHDANGSLDVQVYTAITSPKPVRIFALTGLLYGDVKISAYNTLLTGQVDPASSQNRGLPPAEQSKDLFREFQWSDQAGTLTPVAFTGLYPDQTRYQAEFEQDEVNSGQGFQQWRLSAVTTAQHFAQDILGWASPPLVTVLSGGGTHDVRAQVQIKDATAGGAPITLALSRLELNPNGGIWEVTDVTTEGMTLTTPQQGQQVSSPLQATGSEGAFVGKGTSIIIFDHDRTTIGQMMVPQASGAGNAPFTLQVPYTSSMPDGIQEGSIALYSYTGNHVIAGAVMVKILLSPS